MKKLIFYIFFVFFSAIYAASLSPDLYPKLVKIDELIAQKSYQKAHKIIEDLLKNKARKVDRAYIYRSLAFLHLSQNDLNSTQKALLESLQTKGLDEKDAQSLNLSLAEIYMTNADYKNAKKIATKLIKNKNYKAYLVLANINFLQKDYYSCIKNTQKSLQHLKPTITHYSLLFASFYETKQFKKALDMAKNLVKTQPQNSTFWQYLANAFASANQNLSALSSLEAIYLGFEQKDEFLINLAQNFYAQNLPFKCVQVLEKTQKTPNELLFYCLLSSRDYKNAKKIANKILKTNQDLKITISLARLYSQSLDYKKAKVFYKKALVLLQEKQQKEKLLLEFAYLAYLYDDFKTAKTALLQIKSSKNKKTAQALLKAINSQT